LTIASGTPLHSKPVGGVPCAFRTCYPVTLWPVAVNAAEITAPSRLKPPLAAVDSDRAIRVELQCAKDASFPALKMGKLRFYLDGESGVVNTIYELLFSRLNRIQIRDLTPGSRLAPITLPASSLRAVGFESDEGMVPSPASTFAGHRLLMEYFAFPEKFFFIDLCGLERIADAGFKESIEIIFLLAPGEGAERLERLELEISKKTFRLGCAPIVNLFQQTAEPVQLTHQRAEYAVNPDVRRPYAVEVYSINEVGAVNTATQKIRQIEPFYSLRHSGRDGDRDCFWLARHRASTLPNDNGTDVFLSVVDLALKNADPGANVLTIRTTCSNRDLPGRLPFGNQDSDFEIEGATPMKRIVALIKPTKTQRPVLGKGALWRLVSHLSLNYLSLVEQGKEALKEILRLYDTGRSAYSQNVIQSILEVKSRRHFARLVSEHGVSFARGLRIEIQLDEQQFTGGGAFLFGAVLDRFFGMAASLNSFTQLSITTPQRKEPLHEWQPRSGRKILL
jgi:type VI secretion system protein ImpG